MCKHKWEAEDSGCEENPGCWSDGGDLVFHEVCAKCGAFRHERVANDGQESVAIYRDSDAFYNNERPYWERE